MSDAFEPQFVRIDGVRIRYASSVTQSNGYTGLGEVTRGAIAFCFFRTLMKIELAPGLLF